MYSNSDGQVTKDEMKALLSKHGEAVDDLVINKRIKIVNTNGYDKIIFMSSSRPQRSENK